MIYVAHATSPAIPNLMLYDRAASRYTYIRTHYTYVRTYYMYIRIYPREPPGLSPADLTETYRCRCDKKGAANFALANPSTPRTLPEDRRRVPAVTHRKIRRWYTRGGANFVFLRTSVVCAPEKFSYRYNRAGRARTEENFRSKRDLELHVKGMRLQAARLSFYRSHRREGTFVKLIAGHAAAGRTDDKLLRIVVQSFRNRVTARHVSDNGRCCAV